MPSNLHLRPDQIRWELDSDTVQWLEHLPGAVEDGDRLFVVIHEDHEKPFCIMEAADDGTAMLVWRTDHLGEDTYTNLRRMRHVPLHKRLDEIEKQEEKDAAAKKQDELDDLWERIGGPMYHDLHRYGFAHGAKSTNGALVKRRQRYGA